MSSVNRKCLNEKNERIKKMKHDTYYFLFNNVNILPYNNIFIFSQEQIDEIVKMQCLTLKIGTENEEFIKQHPVRNPFLLTDGKEIKAWAMFIQKVYIHKGKCIRKVHIKTLKPGYSLNDNYFKNEFPGKFRPKDPETFKAFLE